MGFNYEYREDTDHCGKWTYIRLLGFINNKEQLQLLLNVEEVAKKLATTGSATIETDKVYNGKRFVGVTCPEKVGRSIFISPKILYVQSRGEFIKIGCANLSYYFKPCKEKTQNVAATI